MKEAAGCLLSSSTKGLSQSNGEGWVCSRGRGVAIFNGDQLDCCHYFYVNAVGFGTNSIGCGELKYFPN